MNWNNSKNNYHKQLKNETFPLVLNFKHFQISSSPCIVEKGKKNINKTVKKSSHASLINLRNDILSNDFDIL